MESKIRTRGKKWNKRKKGRRQEEERNEGIR